MTFGESDRNHELGGRIASGLTCMRVYMRVCVYVVCEEEGQEERRMNRTMLIIITVYHMQAKRNQKCPAWKDPDWKQTTTPQGQCAAAHLRMKDSS